MLRTIILAGVLLLAAITLASMIPSYRWWLRIWDFPRLAVLALAAVLLVASLASLSGHSRLLAALAMAAVVLWQGWRIYPYTPLASSEVAIALPDRTNCIKAMSFNVLQTNRNFDATIRAIEAENPDILLLLETDSKWTEALEPVTSRYPHRLLAPLDNLYGLAFYTRLDMAAGEVRYLVDDETPSVAAELSTGGSAQFLFLGLHPRPPRPGEDTEQRDAEIAIAARQAARQPQPVLAMGDFNDVAWSRTSRLFKRIGGYVDPRIGRGFYATFPARLPVFRWPLDHLFMTPDFTVAEMRVMENLGSDHLPVVATLCLAPKVAKVLNDAPPAPNASDVQEMRETIADGKASARDDKD
ncbi:MAG: endonuclease/exonuclease/phosphatase family protein [Blastomonas sp.]